MSNNDTAFLNPRMITWAIDRSIVGRDLLVQRLKIQPDMLEAWETGRTNPLFGKALELSTILNIPFGYFYLTEPPVDEVPIPDRRTLTNNRPTTISPNFRDVLYRTLSQQDWYRDYAAEEGSEPLSFIAKFNSHNKIQDVALDIRQRLQMTPRLRQSSADHREYLKALIASAESAGIIVMRRGIVGGNTKRSLNKDEFQGFALSDPLAPIVFINNNDFNTSKIFTLLHEISHLWIGASGISLVDENGLALPNDNIESFCNSVAAEALVPAEEFASVWEGTGKLVEIENLASHFWVSTLVILRRAREVVELPYPLYERLRNETVSKMTEPGKGWGRAKFRGTLDSRNSQIIMDAVIRDVRLGGTTHRDGAYLTATSLRTFVKVMEGNYTA